MQQAPAPTRPAAAFIIAMGLIAFGVNHFAVVHMQRLYPQLIMAGALCVVMGLGGLVAPRLMDFRRPAASSRSGARPGTGRALTSIGTAILFILGLGLWFYIWKYVY
jgi:hypothetical protein